MQIKSLRERRLLLLFCQAGSAPRSTLSRLNTINHQPPPHTHKKKIFNPPNAAPIVIEKIPEAEFYARASQAAPRRQSLQIKQAYRLSARSLRELRMVDGSVLEPLELIGQEFL